jgi:hypothetical protein
MGNQLRHVLTGCQKPGQRLLGHPRRAGLSSKSLSHKTRKNKPFSHFIIPLYLSNKTTTRHVHCSVLVINKNLAFAGLLFFGMSHPVFASNIDNDSPAFGLIRGTTLIVPSDEKARPILLVNRSQIEKSLYKIGRPRCEINLRDSQGSAVLQPGEALTPMNSMRSVWRENC